MKPITVLSLFDGMSCGQIALERAGIPVKHYLASEIDPHAIKITQKNYPGTRQLGNIVDLKPKHSGGIDLFIGGSPCQGFSFAGKQLNFDDPRSKLFFEFVRLLKECEPRYFLLENVKMKKEYQDAISEYLGVEPIEINSSLVSAQNRKRLYWTDIPGVEQPKDRYIYLKDIVTNGEALRDKSQTILSTIYKENAKSMIKRSKKGLLVFEKGVYRKFDPIECERLQTVPDNYTEGVSNTQRYKMLGNGWTVDVIAHIFSYLRGAL